MAAISMLALLASPLFAQTTIDRQVSSNSDDAEEDSGGGMSLYNSKFELGQKRWVGLRFQNMTIPQGATIVSAYVSIRAADSNSESTQLTIYGHDTDDTTTFTSSSSNINNRTRTSESVAWSGVSSWSLNNWYNSPEIKTIVQEIVDRSGWASGNDMAILLRTENYNGKRIGHARDQSSSYAAILHVEYALPTTYYVRTDGSDSNAGTGSSSSQAWRTINNALQSSPVREGDTIYVRPGTYNESVTPNEDGTSSRPIKIIADTDGTVFGTAGAVVVQAPSSNEALDISGDDYLQFTGFTFRGEDTSYDTVAVASAPGTELHRCIVYNGGDHGIEMSGSSTTLTLTNCLIYDNNNDGIGMSGGTLTVWNSTFAANGSDGIQQDGGTSTIRNSIFASHPDDGLDLNGGSMSHTYNCVWSNASNNFEGTSQSTGEITSDPQFLGGGNYRIASSSPAANGGTSSGGPPNVDLDGVSRPQGAGYDMGCYESGGNLLVGHWKLDETSGSTAYDSSGNANHGTLSGLSFTSDSVSGRDATGLDFGGNDYISVTNNSTVQITSALTITAWIKGDAWGSSSDVNAIVRKGTDNPNNYQFAIADGKIALMLDDSDTGGGVRGDTVLETGQWYHVAATWDGSYVRIYLNGALDGSPVARSGTIGTDTRSLYIGGRPSSDYFDGALDDVRLYNYALSDAEIREVYGLLGHWKFDETSPATTAVDSSGNGYDAPLSGGPTWTSGRVDGAIYFDGSGDYATTSAAFPPPSDGTITFWMKTAALGGTQRVFGLGGEWEARQDASGVLTFDIAGDTRFATPSLSANAWYHIAAVFDDTNDTYAVYVNGTLTSSGAQTYTPQSAATLSFGTRTGSTEYWQGTLDDFRIYNRRLSAEEIAEQYSGAAPQGVHILKWSEVQ